MSSWWCWWCKQEGHYKSASWSSDVHGKAACIRHQDELNKLSDRIRKSIDCNKMRKQIAKLQAKVADLEREKDEIYKESMGHHEAQIADMRDRIRELEGKLELWRKTRSGIDDYWAELDPLKAIHDLKAAGEWPE